MLQKNQRSVYFVIAPSRVNPPSGTDYSGASNLGESSTISQALQELLQSMIGQEEPSSTESLKKKQLVSVHLLERMASTEERKFPELVFAFGCTSDDNKPILVITQCRASYHPLFDYTSQVHITIQQDCSYQVHILLCELESGIVSNEDDVHRVLERFSIASPYKFCPGLEWSHYQSHYFDEIRFHLKSVRCTDTSFNRVDSVNYKLWFEVPANVSRAEKALSEVLCSACK